MPEARRAYIDSCCFIDMVKTDVGRTLSSDRELDVWHLKRLLEANRDGEVELFTSTLSIAECTHIGDEDLNAEVKSAFERLLLSGQYVRLVQITPFIAQDARDLRWIHGIAARGADSIHLASASAMRCEEFISSDVKLQRASTHSNQLARLGLYPKRGQETACLPAKYRQLNFDDTSRH